jgi:hypothetical protein
MQHAAQYREHKTSRKHRLANTDLMMKPKPKPKQGDNGNHETSLLPTTEDLRIPNLSPVMNKPPGLTMTTFLDVSQSPLLKPEFTQHAPHHASTPAAMEAKEIVSCPRPSTGRRFVARTTPPP